MSKWMNETPQNKWHDGARKGSLWLCYAGPLAGKQKSGIPIGPLAGKQKSGISGNRRRPKPTPWERNSRGS